MNKKMTVILCAIMALSNVLFIHHQNNKNIKLADDYIVEPVFAETIIPTPNYSLYEQIQKSFALLKSSPPLRFEEKKVGNPSTSSGSRKAELIRKQIALAIFNTNTLEIIEKRFWLKEQEIKNYKKTSIITLEPVFQNDPIIVRVKWWNSFNTLYEIQDHPEMFVIGNKYLLLSTTIPDPEERSGGKYTDIIYIPYSDNLAQTEVIQAGLDYINTKISQAFQLLKDKNVLSRSIPGSLITSTVNEDFLKNIIVVEHIDPDAFKVSTDMGKALTDRVLTIIGANRENAYRYTGSPAGANGISQFIKSTYLGLVKKYPEAKLIKDFQIGTTTHENAFQAMVLFFDSHKKELENKITRKIVLNQLGGITEEMLAASYNGGATRVIRSVNNYGLSWIEGQLSASLPKIFRRETLGYISKFVAIRNLHLF